MLALGCMIVTGLTINSTSRSTGKKLTPVDLAVTASVI
jgi:hypothetical protein